MKKIQNLLLVLTGFVAINTSSAQTNAMDFNILDCNGNPHSLFGDLDAGKAVILEFFMTSCSPCVTAGNALEAMKADLLVEFPGLIKSYAFGYNNTYSCTTVNNWVTTNGFTSVPSDSGAAQVAYYGGMGMPTIVILGGGTNHLVLGSPYLGFTVSDTATMANDIRNALNTAGVNESQNTGLNIQLYPNPANAATTIELDLIESTELTIEIVDVTGRTISTVNHGKINAGKFVRTIDTQSLAQGSYTIRTLANDKVFLRKLNIVR